MRYLFLILVVIGIAWAQWPSQTPVVTDPVAVKLKAESEARVSEAIKTLDDVPQIPKEVGQTISHAAKESLRVAYEFMAKSRRSLHRDAERKAILEKLAKNEEAVKAAELYLRDLALTREHFGERQAEARMFSIGLLRERAVQGDMRPLEETTRHLAEALSSRDAGNKGRQRDLEDLVASYVSVEQGSALHQLGQIVDKLGYRPALKQQFVAGIYFGLQTAHAKQEIIDRLEQIGISVGGKG